MTKTEKHIKELIKDIKQNCKPMYKTKRQRQLDLLDKLIDRLGTSKTDHPTDDVLWVQKKIAYLQNTEGDVKGLSMDDMLHANVIWRKHGYMNDPVTGQ